MKITPMSGARAPAPAVQDPAPVQNDKLRRIKMQTASPMRDVHEQATSAQNPAPADNSDNGEQAIAASEDPKPLSPQFAALAKAKRAAQVKEAELTAREERLKAQETGERFTPDQLKERIKADALGFVLENGGTYDQLTQEVLRSMEGGGPALTKVENDLRQELKALRAELDGHKKTQTDSQTESEKLMLTRNQREAEQLVATDDNYQMIRETGSAQDVARLIDAIRKDSKGVEVISVKEAADMIEEDLLNESLKVARIEKVRNQIMQGLPQKQGQRTQDASQTSQVRNVMNLGNTTPQYSRKERALAAALGKKLA